MANELVKITQLPISEIMSIGKAFAESGMFADTRSAAQAIVKIQAGQEIGIPPFAAMTGIHIISGKPTIGAGLIASRIKGSGKYDYKVKEQSDKICSVDFYQGKEMIGNSTFTIEDARRAQTKNMEKFPKNMLFARAISNGVKWFCPDIFSGPVYTPEEMGEVETQDIPHEVVNRMTTQAEADQIMPMVHISQPSQDMPAMNDEEAKYRTKTNDIEVICELIDNATDPRLLKVFHSINTPIFKTNNELEQRLIEKGKSLKTQKAA